ncbi:hypothetical protein [Gottfriedia acidiceleris]|uniref:hypothetical protein n=1 Tax=Gottfriedia acidiceleris TaxID=371036 RepID=UPI003D20E5F3
MDFPTIQTNFWDAIIAVPLVMVLTQLLKILLKINRKYVSLIALVLGLCISVFISHRHHLIAGIFMGWFYGYAAIGSYASLKTAIKSFRSENNDG